MAAQTEIGATAQWSRPEVIPGYDRVARPPFLVADQNHIVHAFSYEMNRSARGAIYYRYWAIDTGWSLPVDILLPGPGASYQTIQTVHLDSAGRLHLVFYTGDQTVGDLYYSWAYAVNADQGAAWSALVPIGPKAGPVATARMVSNANGDLVLIYGGQQAGAGVYEVRSTDAGETWSAPTVVSLVDRPETWPASIRLEVDPAGRMHAVWSLVGTEGVGLELEYSRWEPENQQWTQVTSLAQREPGEYSVNWPSLLAFNDELMLIYQDSFPATRWMRRSSDGGQTWSSPVRPFPQIGEYEYAVLLRDSQDQIHMILGNRTIEPEIHGMWHSQWLNERWTPIQPIISGPQQASFDPSAPQAVISQGNVLLVSWRNDVRREYMTGIWFAYARLDAPELPENPLPFPPAASPVSTGVNETPHPPATTLAVTATPRSVQANLGTEVSDTTSPATPIFWGVIPTLVLLGGLLILRYRKRRGF